LVNRNLLLPEVWKALDLRGDGNGKWGWLHRACQDDRNGAICRAGAGAARKGNAPDIDGRSRHWKRRAH
jgi:hypothetical protein